MKRSEVIKLIADSLNSNHEEDRYSQAEIALKVIEEIGMVPTRFEESTTYTEIAGVSIGHPLYKLVYTWEKE